MSPHDLLSRLEDQPFKPFRVRLSNNNVIDFLQPGSVIVGPTSAIMPLEYIEERRARAEAGFPVEDGRPQPHG